MKKLISFIVLFASITIASKSVQAQSKWGSDSASCVKHFSIYREFVKQKNFKDAKESWEWCFSNCPLVSENLYIDGVSIMKTAINGEKKNKERRRRLVDSLFKVYDQRVQYFPAKEGNILGRKAGDMILLIPDSVEMIYNVLKKSVELSENKSDAYILMSYMQYATKMVEKKIVGKEVVMDVFDKVNDYAEWNIKNKPTDTTFKAAKTGIEQYFEPYATCPDLIAIFSKKFDANPNDTILLAKITKILDKKKCTDDELFFKATENLHKLSPTAKSAYLMGKLCLSKNQFAKAAEYLNEAAKLFTDNEEKADCYLVLAQAYLETNQFSAARSAAYKVIEFRPSSGYAYMLIGEMYARSAKSCGDNELTTKVAYWAAVDKFAKARSVDPSLEKQANEKISFYSRYFPNDETIFFYGLQKGSAYTVGCWIGETTTVR